MDLLTAVFLGIVQGLTEFLPISSSGHLVIFQHLFGMTEPALFFDISVHFGTLVAVVIFFRAEIKSILVSLSAILLGSVIVLFIVGWALDYIGFKIRQYR